jgi:hypothetical protein
VKESRLFKKHIMEIGYAELSGLVLLYAARVIGWVVMEYM